MGVCGEGMFIEREGGGGTIDSVVALTRTWGLLLEG